MSVTVDIQGSARQVTVLPATRALSALSRVDYADAFLVETDAAQDRTAEQWARATLEGAAGAGRKLWSALSTAGLLPRARSEGPAQPDRFVAGWELRRSTPNIALLGASARIGLSAELLFVRQERGLLWATFVQQQNPIARALWAGLAPVHRRVVRHLIERVGWSA
jgi:Protein of unknown function (DUF2867)